MDIKGEEAAAEEVEEVVVEVEIAGRGIGLALIQGNFSLIYEFVRFNPFCYGF